MSSIALCTCAHLKSSLSATDSAYSRSQQAKICQIPLAMIHLPRPVNAFTLTCAQLALIQIQAYRTSIIPIRAACPAAAPDKRCSTLQPHLYGVCASDEHIQRQTEWQRREVSDCHDKTPRLQLAQQVLTHKHAACSPSQERAGAVEQGASVMNDPRRRDLHLLYMHCCAGIPRGRGNEMYACCCAWIRSKTELFTLPSCCSCPWSTGALAPITKYLCPDRHRAEQPATAASALGKLSQATATPCCHGLTIRFARRWHRLWMGCVAIQNLNITDQMTRGWDVVSTIVSFWGWLHDLTV